MTYQEQTRGFHVTSYYVVQKIWTLQQKKTNNYTTAVKTIKMFSGSTLVPPAGANKT